MYLMNSILSKYLDKFVDDILIYSKTKEEHDEHLQIVLQVLREYKFYAKFNKCEFFKDKIQYLGHVTSKEGISANPGKIREIMEWFAPKDVLNA